MGITVGFASAAQRCPHRPGLVDELGTPTWRQLDERINALAAAPQQLPSGQPKVVGIMCRNHRGFVENCKVPREITVLDELPPGNTGKILRAELQSRVTG